MSAQNTADSCLLSLLFLSPVCPSAPRSFAQHLPAGPGCSVLFLMPPVALALWLLPLGALPRGARPCWAPVLPDLSSLGSRGPFPLCGSEQVWTSGPSWGLFHPRGCLEPSGQDTGLSRGSGPVLSTHTLSPGPGLLALPSERSRGTKSLFCGQPGTRLAGEAPDSPFGPSGDAGATCWLLGLPGSILLCFCACSSLLRVFLLLWLP